MKLVWFRRDLRSNDNPALYEASLAKQGVIALHITTPQTWHSHKMSEVQQNWLAQNLNDLQKSLKKYNIPLIRTSTNYFSECYQVILNIITKYNIKGLYFNEEYEWDERKRDCLVIEKLKLNNIRTFTFHDQFIIPPSSILNQQSNPYVVFTPYKKACLNYIHSDIAKLLPYDAPLIQEQTTIDSYNDSPLPPAHTQDISWLKSGSDAGLDKINKFVETKVNNYEKVRDIPSIYGTSCLSPYLALGVISARQCIASLLSSTKHYSINEILSNNGAMTWLSELMWRDFYKMICLNFPRISRSQPFKLKTNKIEWSNNEEHLIAWQKGKTGVPIVDAAMRQLNKYGWMHNRLRMVTAMYLTKNLWIDWRKGESYFASNLVDWDFSSNNGGWQWSASTGTDSVPYFRIFNPISQSERFDPHGKFIRQYCPELQQFSDKDIHNPLPSGFNKIDYPNPLVDLKRSRLNAIEHFKSLK